MIRLLSDENLPNALIDALRAAGLDVVRVRDLQLAGSPDPDLLARAAADDRVFLTFDRKTIPGFAYDRVRAGLPMPGAIVLDQALSIGGMADEVHVAAACATADEFRDVVVYLPQRVSIHQP